MKLVLFQNYGPCDIPLQFFEEYNIPHGVVRHGYFTSGFATGETISRTDPRLIDFVEKHSKIIINQKHGDVSESEFWGLVVAEIPSGTKFRICEYDGAEYIETESDIDWAVAD